MSAELVQILPPLRQSLVELAACPRAYVAVVIDGREQGDSIASERGQDVHRVMSQYVNHCAAKQVSADWEMFNKLAEASGPVAGPILDGIRDRYVVDWAHVYGTEVTLRLDCDFQPALYQEDIIDGLIAAVEHVDDAIPNVTYSGRPAAYVGTLDVILLSDDGKRAKINDYKSHPAPFDADTFQASLYCLMLFKHLPALEVVTFELDFVRYTNCLRAVRYERKDIPELQAEVSRARERQKITHANPDDAMALPCATCTYCPLMRDLTCPIRLQNDRLIVKAEERLIAIQQAIRLLAFHRPLLKEWAIVNGDVLYRDANGRLYVYGEMPVEQTAFPLDETSMQVLREWTEATGERWNQMGLKISSTSIKPKLKAKKRLALLERFEDSIIERSTKPRYATRTPEEGIQEDYVPYGDE